MPIAFHANSRSIVDNRPRTVSVFSENRQRLIAICDYIDCQGYQTARIHAEPEYLVDLKTWRVGYILPSGDRQKHVEGFRKAHDRAFRMAKGKLSRKSEAEYTAKRRAMGKKPNYVRVAERKLFYGAVPNLSQNSARQP